MAHQDFNYTEVDERAFAIFLMEGLHYFLDQDPSLRRCSVIDYCQRLWNVWDEMSDDEKRTFRDRARDELRRLRRYHRADIYRSAMRDQIPEVDDTRRNRNRNLQN
jgi:hypothetical protein